MFNKSRLTVFVISILFLGISVVLAGPLEDCAEYTKLGVPGQQGELLCRTGYLLAHSPEHKTPLWVIERLTRERATSKVVPRYDKFQADPDLRKGQRAEPSDYRNNGLGLDRGHMAPAADFRWDQQAMVQCFYLSNMVPQVGEGMNRGIWKHLEEYVRKWAISRGELFIFTGPIYYGGVKKIIGRNGVAVPSHLYKVVYDPDRKEAIAFAMPNEKLNSEDMPMYIVTIRDIETWTGLNFLSNLEPNLQEAVETSRAGGLW